MVYKFSLRYLSDTTKLNWLNQLSGYKCRYDYTYIAKMDKRKRKGRVEIRVDWDDKTYGDWHYVPKSSALAVLPNQHFEAGGRVSLKWRVATWIGTIAPKRKKSSAGQL